MQKRAILGRRERRHLCVRNQIKRAAEEVILEKGYGKTSIKDIMERTGLGYATFYNYYKSKKDVVMDIVAEHIELAQQGIKFAPPDEDDLHVRIYTSLISGLEIFYNSKNMWRIVRSGLAYEPELARVWNDVQSSIFETIKQEGKWSMKWGLIHDCLSLNTVLVVIWGTFESMRNFVMDNDLTVEELQRMTWEYSYMATKAVFKVDRIPAELMQHVRRGLPNPTIAKIDKIERVPRRRCNKEEKDNGKSDKQKMEAATPKYEAGELRQDNNHIGKG